MTAFSRLRLAALMAALSASPLLAAGFEAPALRTSVTVSAAVVTLGDLVENAGDKSQIPVFRAPDPGETGQVSAGLVVDAARRHGLFPDGSAALSEIAVTRAGRRIALDELAPALREALAQRARIADPATLEVNFDSSSSAMNLPLNAEGGPQIADVAWAAPSGRFDAVVTVRRRDGAVERAAISGEARETEMVLVPTRDLERGAMLSASDVELVRKTRGESASDAVHTEKDGLGREARRALRAGQPLRTVDLAEPELVKRGAIVTIVHRTPGLLLTARGQALRGGTRGEAVQVINQQSKRVLQAVVTGPSEVTVTPNLPLVSAQ